MTRAAFFLTLIAGAAPLARAQTPDAGSGPPQVAPLPVDAGAPAAPEPEATPAGATETDCQNRRDEDGDSLVDCADADCYGQNVCAGGDANENTNDRCNDWVDNDGDGAIDCEDDDCGNSNVTVCRGSHRGAPAATGAAEPELDEGIELGDGDTVDDLIGTGDDLDGERNDELCSDGVDNDEDGRADCADFGCRFDTQVTVCQGQPGIRFSLNAHFELRHEYAEAEDGDQVYGEDGRLAAGFDRAQLRVLGPIPFIQNSFFMVQARVDRVPRLTYLLLVAPLFRGHALNLMANGAGLSSAASRGTQKQLLLEPCFLVFSPFAQSFAGGVAVVGRPVGSLLRYDVGLNLGERLGFRTFPGERFTWGASLRMQLNAIGMYDPLDTPYIYTPVPTALAFAVGAKYEVRRFERFPGFYGMAVFRSGHLHLLAESLTKLELDFGSIQTGFLAEAGVLIIPKWLMLAADFGGFWIPRAFEETPTVPFGSDTLRRPISEWQARAAAHLYVVRNVGILSLVYTHHVSEPDPDSADHPVLERIVGLNMQYRF